VNFPFPGQLPAPLRADPPDWPPALGGVRVRVGGKVALNGIWMHRPAPPAEDVRISFPLGGRFRTFNTRVSLNDGPGRCSPLTFAVHGDGRLLWKSDPVSAQSDRQSCLGLPVRGVERLTLEVSGAGNEQGTHAVWIDPYVTE
jgi:hypothetical protein